jgi:outer membrane murein-binding lipoprotein Lpp
VNHQVPSRNSLRTTILRRSLETANNQLVVFSAFQALAIAKLSPNFRQTFSVMDSKKINEIATRIAAINTRLDSLDKKIDGLDGLLDDVKAIAQRVDILHQSRSRENK